MKSKKQTNRIVRQLQREEKQQRKAEKQRLLMLVNEEKKKRQHIISSKYRCKHCSQWISYASRRGHLRVIHQIDTDDPKPHFDTMKQVREEEREKRWKKYMDDLSTPETRKKEGYRCGEKVNGEPFVRIVYNSVETNRRKH